MYSGTEGYGIYILTFVFQLYRKITVITLDQQAHFQELTHQIHTHEPYEEVHNGQIFLMLRSQVQVLAYQGIVYPYVQEQLSRGAHNSQFVLQCPAPVFTPLNCQRAPQSGQPGALCMRPPKHRLSNDFPCSKCPHNNGIGH